MPQNLPKFKFKKDSYARSRGAPKMLFICCSTCDDYIISYQKDGPGPLLRCYLDRIHHPEQMHNKQHEPFNKNDCPNLECFQCKKIIGVPFIYEKEDRPAYHMRPGSFMIKKKSS